MNPLKAIAILAVFLVHSAVFAAEPAFSGGFVDPGAVAPIAAPADAAPLVPALRLWASAGLLAAGCE